MGALLRQATLTLVLSFMASCGGPSQPDPNAPPRAITDLPERSADLQFVGPVAGHATKIRLGRCEVRTDSGSQTFYAGGYVSLSDHWYYVDFVSLIPLPVRGNSRGYEGPGLYKAYADFRPILVGSNGLVHGDKDWGVPDTSNATITVSPAEKGVLIGSVGDWQSARPVISTTLALWPRPPDTSGQVPGPVPPADQIEQISGSWSCS